MTVRVLLDTHALLWFITDDPQLGRRARATIEEPDMHVLVSTASLWEIAIKHSMGKLPLARSFAETFPAQLDANTFQTLQAEVEHLARLIDLPFHHRDPFDRLIIAQAIVEGLPVLTRDGAFDDYPVETIWD